MLIDFSVRFSMSFYSFLSWFQCFSFVFNVWLVDFNVNNVNLMIDEGIIWVFNEFLSISSWFQCFSFFDFNVNNVNLMIDEGIWLSFYQFLVDFNAFQRNFKVKVLFLTFNLLIIV